MTCCHVGNKLSEYEGKALDREAGTMEGMNLDTHVIRDLLSLPLSLVGIIMTCTFTVK